MKKPSGMENPQFFSRYKTQMLLGQTAHFLNALIAEGYLPTITVRGKQYIPSAAVRRFMESASSAQGEKAIGGT